MTPAAPPALRWRALVWAALLMLFYALPWLRWNGRQALLFDLPARRFDLFGLTLWPQDVGVLFGLVAVLACTLVLLTTMAGRVWCGHACPQTLWSGLFRWIERSATRRLRPPALARVVKHLAWAAVALWTGTMRRCARGGFRPGWSSWPAKTRCRAGRDGGFVRARLRHCSAWPRCWLLVCTTCNRRPRAVGFSACGCRAGAPSARAGQCRAAQ